MPAESKKPVNIFLYYLRALLLSLTPWGIFSSFFKDSDGKYSRHFFMPQESKMVPWQIQAPQNFSRAGTMIGLIMLGLIGGGIIPGVALVATPAAIATVYFASLAFLYVLRTLSAMIGLIICKIEIDRLSKEQESKPLPTVPFVIYNAFGYGLFGDAAFATIKKTYRKWQTERAKASGTAADIAVESHEENLASSATATVTITVPESQEIPPLQSSVGVADSIPAGIAVESHEENLASSANAADILLPVNAAIPTPQEKSTSLGNMPDNVQPANPPPSAESRSTSAQLISLFNKTHIALGEMKDRVSTLPDEIKEVDDSENLPDEIKEVDGSEKLFIAEKPEGEENQTPDEEYRSDSRISFN